MNRPVLIGLSGVVGLALAELLLQLACKPSEIGSAELFKYHLPPFNITYEFQENLTLSGADGAAMPAPAKNNPDGNLTRGDIRGPLIEDPVIGYRILPDYRSKNDWFQSNNVGARYRSDITKELLPDRKRTLFFGDSFTKGVVPQEVTFVHLLEAQVAAAEMLNFGVGGYGMGQAYLLFQSVTQGIDYDHAALVLAPGADLWRDINTNRYIARGWKSRSLVPRYRLEGQELRLIAPPFTSIEEQLEQDPDEKVIREHMRRYDSLYLPMVHDQQALDWSVIWRMLRFVVGMPQIRDILSNTDIPGSEATRVTRAIAANMQEDASNANATFSLVLLPDRNDLQSYREDEDARQRWHAMREFICEPVKNCIDLMPRMAELDPSDVDVGADGGHYGPNANRRIAQFMAPYFRASVDSLTKD